MVRSTVIALVSIILACSGASAQNPPASDPQVVTYAKQSIAAMAGTASINDVTLTGNATWSGSDSGTATLEALGTGESRMDLALTSGTRTEIRDAQTGASLGQWIAHAQALDTVQLFRGIRSLWRGALELWKFGDVHDTSQGETETSLCKGILGWQVWFLV